MKASLKKVEQSKDHSLHISKGWRQLYCPDKFKDGKPKKLTEKDNIPKANKFRYVTLLTVTALWGYDHGLPIGNSHGKKRLANNVHKRYLQFDVYVS